MRDFDLGRVLGTHEMLASLYRHGYTGADLKAQGKVLKESRMGDLESFAGGPDAFDGAKLDPAMKAVLIEVTAIRYLLAQARGEIKKGELAEMRPV